MDPSSPERPNPLRRSRLPLAAALACIVGAGAYWLLHGSGTAPPAVPRGDSVASAPAAAPAEPAPEANAPAPVLDAAGMRALLESLSADQAFRRWLAEDDAVRRWAVVTDNLAEGVTPRRELALLAPSGSFSVVREAGGLVISPESYRRYDRFAEAIAAVDARTAARVYRALRGPLAAAYRALGYPDRSFDQVTANALGRLERAPVPGDRVQVVDEGGVYLFADRALERLGDVEKHLLRMGPRNARLVQAKAKEIREALGLQAADAGAGQQRGR